MDGGSLLQPQQKCIVWGVLLFQMPEPEVSSNVWKHLQGIVVALPSVHGDVQVRDMLRSCEKGGISTNDQTEDETETEVCSFGRYQT
jgi:hypothetical protein